MQLYLRLAWRNVWRQRRRTFIIAAAMGVIMALLILYDGLIGGFEQAIYGNAIQAAGREHSGSRTRPTTRKWGASRSCRWPTPMRWCARRKNTRTWWQQRGGL